jgi:hypothetical protein
MASLNALLIRILSSESAYSILDNDPTDRQVHPGTSNPVQVVGNLSLYFCGGFFQHLFQYVSSYPVSFKQVFRIA